MGARPVRQDEQSRAFDAGTDRGMILGVDRLGGRTVPAVAALVVSCSWLAPP